MIVKCKCGCGQEVKRGNRYIHNHHFRGHTPWNKGKIGIFSEEYRRKIGDANRGIPLSKEHRQKISKANKGKPKSKEHKRKISETLKGTKFSKERKRKLSILAKERNVIDHIINNHHIRPNKPERAIIDLINEHNLPFKYVGDGQVWIYGLNPDFIESNGQKKIIEVFGDYWHNRDNIDWRRTEWGRKAVFAQLGYKTLILWDSEIQQHPNKILDEIYKFMEE